MFTNQTLESLLDLHAHPLSIALSAALVAGCAALLIHRRHEGRFVREWLAALPAAARNSERTLAIAVGGLLHDMRRSMPQDPVMPVVGAALGATPGAVIRHGGCCAGLSRLCIVSLAEMGIPSRQITLYHREGNAQHCLVEAFIGHGAESLILDPAYALYYTDGRGQAIGLQSLQQGQAPVFRAFSSGEPCTYPPYPYYEFDFTTTKTANWTKNATRRAAYRLLHTITGGGIDRLRLPPWLEWPQVQLAILLTTAVIPVHLAAVLLQALLLA